MKYIILPSIVLTTLSTLVQADITTDGTVGIAQNLTPTQGHYTIGQELGSLKGSNLFHSFQQFNINTGESATFTGDNSIQNVISRVTGGNASQINGLLQSQVGHANFFFINPAGVVFGENAQIDVPAAFHISTAGQLNFADGSQFNALDPEASSLTIATPESFGFSQGQAGALQIVGGQLGFKPGTDVSISANQLHISGVVQNNGDIAPAAIFVQQTDPSLEKGLHLGLVSVDAETAQTIPLTGLTETSTGGDLSIENAVINISGNGVAQLSVRAGETKLKNSLLSANNLGDNTMASSEGINLQVNKLVLDNARLENSVAGKGDAASVLVQVDNDLQLLAGGLIDSSTSAQGHAGEVVVKARQLIIDEQNSGLDTGILSSVKLNSATGHTGTISVQVEKDLQLLNSGGILSSTLGQGDAGKVSVTAGQLTIDGQNTGIASVTASVGNAGTVSVQIDNDLQLLAGGIIDSSTSAQGQAGKVVVKAGQLTIDGQNSGLDTGVASSAKVNSTGNAETVSVQVAKELQLLNGGFIASVTLGQGDAGKVSVTAGQLTIDGQNTGITSGTANVGNAGTVSVQVDNDLQLLAGGIIDSSTSAQGQAGKVVVKAGQLTIDGQNSGLDTGVTSSAKVNSTGNAGTISVQVDKELQILGGVIDSSTFGQGDAGEVSVTAGQLTIDGLGGISSLAAPGSSGDAGIISVQIEKNLQLLNGGFIASSTSSQGNAREISVIANQLKIDGQNTGITNGTTSAGNAGTVLVQVEKELKLLAGGQISSPTLAEGQGGEVIVIAGQLTIDGQNTGITSGTANVGNAGTVSVQVDNDLQLLAGGEIDSSTSAQGQAGVVVVTAGQLTIDGQNSGLLTGISSKAQPNSTGNAGTISVQVEKELQLLAGGQIISSTFADGKAGEAIVTAGQLIIDGQNSAITSSAESGSTGDAGTVSVQVEKELQLLTGGQILSATFDQGNAKEVTVIAGQLTIDGQNSDSLTGIGSSSERNATGTVGNVLVTASQAILLNDGVVIISSRNPSLAPVNTDNESASITLNTPILQLNNSRIGAAASGSVDAAQIQINTTDHLDLNNSIISTSAANGNGGSILLSADHWARLKSSNITTSVTGKINGNGGDITFNTPVLVLDTGFIQANTAASQATGGDINLNVEQLVTSRNQLIRGGSEAIELDRKFNNVVQAASPDGVNGNIQITSPELNIVGVLANVGTPTLDTERIEQDPCTNIQDNSLKNLGHGGVPSLQNGENTLPISRLNRIETGSESVSKAITVSLRETYLNQPSVDCYKYQ